jgi:hypothetical protein
VCGESTVNADSTYVLDVASSDQTAGCGTDGASVTFAVAGLFARTGTWVSGEPTTMDLEVVPPTPPGTPPWVRPTPRPVTCLPYCLTQTALAYPPAGETPTSVPSTPATPTGVSSMTATPTPWLGFEARAEYPSEMHVGGSGTVRVTLARTDEGSVTPEPSAVVLTSGPPPIRGTPGAILPDLYGHDFSAYAWASLDAAPGTFEYDRERKQEQQIGELSLLSWEWDVTAREEGPRSPNVEVLVTWRSSQGQPPVGPAKMWSGQLHITVKPKPARFSVGDHLVTLVSGFVGSVLSAPFLFEVFKTVKGRKETAEDKKGRTKARRRRTPLRIPRLGRKK